MHDEWTTHYKGIIEGRTVEVKTYSEGGFRVSTTQGADDDSVNEEDIGSGIFPPPPKVKGDPIDLDGESVDEVREALAKEGFSEQAINEIVSHFPS